MEKKIFLVLIICSLFIIGCPSYIPQIMDFSNYSNDEYLNNLYPHEENFESYLYFGYFENTTTKLYHITVEISKMKLETSKNIFWLIEGYVYDYSNKQAYTLFATSINPKTKFELAQNTIKFGPSGLSWNKNEIRFTIKSSKNLEVILHLPNKFSFIHLKEMQSIAYLTPVLNTTMHISVNNEKNNLDANLTGRGLFFRSYGKLPLAGYEILFLDLLQRKESHIYLQTPKEKQFYAIKSINENNTIISTILPQFPNISYNEVVKDRNRRYAIRYSMTIDNEDLLILPLESNSFTSFFLHDAWIGLNTVMNTLGFKKGYAMGYLYEYSRYKY